ncbi:MAG TPA: hypothetical protein VLF43_01180 [Candidatus Saccharimonadales bacterium]|nr:hypothetical protein [Candidatus Saccharimonadales bacterium]
MNKLFLPLLTLAAVLLIPQNASAHVLLKDSAQGTGAILHVNPDDNPTAGEQANLFFDIKDASLTQNDTASLTITDENDKTVAVPSRLKGSSVSADYIFPNQGLFTLKLIVTKDGQAAHQFVYSQRVSQGTLGDTTTPLPPAWTEIGLITSVLAAVFTAIIVYNRGKRIRTYSKR